MVTAEVRRLTSSPMAVIALFALMCVPILYGGLYLWANQDPYARLDQVPAAIVVEDTGASVDGAERDYGQEVAQQLVDDGRFDWHIVDTADATTGVDGATYDFSVTFPSDFSSSLASASTDDPHQAQVVLTTNDTNAYLASSIGEQAAEAIRVSIVQKVNEEAANQFLLGLSDIRGQLMEAADGATQLVDGSDDAEAGSQQLAEGTSTLSDGATTLAGATDDLAAGARTLADANDALADGAKALAEANQKLSNGASTLADGIQKVADGNTLLATKADDAAAKADAAVAELPQARQAIADELAAQGLTQDQIDNVLAAIDPLGAKIKDGNAKVQALAGQVDQLAAGAREAAAGSWELRDGASQAADGGAALRDGADEAAVGSATLRDGATETATGASTLSSGVSDAADGASDLAAGIAKLHDGAASLRDGLDDGVTQIPDSSPELRADQAETIANPVDLENTTVTTAGNYGAGLAPFFISLAAWIGIYALFLIVKPVSRRAITALHSPLRITAAGWLTPGLLGAAQMIGLFAIVSGVLGFDVANPLATYGLMALASLTFAAMILALNVWLGSVGQFLGLVLMVLQLVTAGGTFPWQTLPGPLAALHHVLPMSFAVDGIRQTMYGGSSTTAWSDAGVLAIWLIVSLAIAAIGVVRMTHQRTLRDLQPSLIG
ncbi:YhgE/Pip domain-containing protein [Demequina aurantiaca]|uniref:YhgE/Pip domain-containing protein n=1 Tax=Demequina aurantiaca TaxID=676200 RepID=UPI000781D584|nr:YhgE/Pip domain-containing protein [Demequina aurantiaca]